MENMETNPNVDPQTADDAGFDNGNLPSAQDELNSSLEKFQLNDEFVSKHFKNGKLYGRFDSLEAVLNTLHSVETKYSNVMRDLKSSDGQQAEGQQAQQTQEPVNVIEVAQPAIAKFIGNDFNFEGLDNDINDIAQKAGISVAEVKLAALEMKEQISKAYDIVGGKSEYQAMIEWGKTNLSEAQRKDFDKALNSGMGEFAIKGLYQDFKASNPQQQQYRRIEGEGGGNVGARPYATFQELVKDREYLNTPQGRSDKAAREAHARRLSLTPPNVIYGR